MHLSGDGPDDADGAVAVVLGSKPLDGVVTVFGIAGIGYVLGNEITVRLVASPGVLDDDDIAGAHVGGVTRQPESFLIFAVRGAGQKAGIAGGGGGAVDVGAQHRAIPHDSFDIVLDDNAERATVVLRSYVHLAC